MVCQWFNLKITETDFSGLTSKLVTTVFFSLTLKSVATISLLSLKTKVVEGFLVCPSKLLVTIW
jgi:hypothetical protein